MNMTQDGRAAICRTDEKTAFDQALALLQQGEVIALPTDTIYGVACDSANPAAIARLYEIKERPREKAIPLLLSGERQLIDATENLPDAVWDMTEQHWPGPLTIIVEAASHLPPILTANGDTVAVRLPDNRVVRVLCAMLGRPLAVSSANLSGHTECCTAKEVDQQIGTRIPLILDGGKTPGGQASTIIDFTQTPPTLLREGPITKNMLSSWL